MSKRISKSRASLWAACLALSFVSGCIQQAPDRLALQQSSIPGHIKPEAARLLPAVMNQADRVIASEATGLWVLTTEGEVFAQKSGQIDSFDLRVQGAQLLIAAYDKGLHQVILHRLDTVDKQWSAPLTVDAGPTAVETLCLYRDADDLLYLFLMGEDGRAEQWLAGQQGQWLATPRQVRSLSIPAASKACEVDDRNHRMLVIEENVGVWSYQASPESDGHRLPVAMRAPFGDLSEGVSGIAVAEQGVWVLDGKESALHYYRYDERAVTWKAEHHIRLATSQEMETLSARALPSHVTVLLANGSKILTAQLAEPERMPTERPLFPMASVSPVRETQPVDRHGDAADDPALWIHPTTPSRSRIIATNKQQGLLAYDLEGHLRQSLPIGRVNNVDVRDNVAVGASRLGVAVASHRDRNSLALFTIDRDSGALSAAGELATPLGDIYGVCLYQPSSELLYAFANDKDGRILQYRIEGATGNLRGTLVREFALDSQPEGCVADDAMHRLYLGEEATGVWAVDARADQQANPTTVIKVGDVLKADVEGLALFRNAEHHWLIISSQGNDSYVVVEATAPHTLVGRFRIGLNVATGIDGASETDGLEVTSVNLGGPWSRGMLVVQDGRNRMPEQPQNFKLVPWTDIESALLPAALSP